MDETEAFLTENTASTQEEEIPMTPAEVLHKLEEIWLNEKFAPDLREYQGDIIDCMFEQIQQLENNLKRLEPGDIRATIHKIELERIQYVLSSYLRIRLEKIEMYTAHIIEEEKERPAYSESKMSLKELEFAKSYLQSIENHLKNMTLRHLPGKHQELSFNKTETIVRPNMDAYVFVKSKENVGEVLIEEDTEEDRNEVISMEEGAQYILRYQPITELVDKGSVELI